MTQYFILVACDLPGITGYQVPANQIVNNRIKKTNGQFIKTQETDAIFELTISVSFI